MTDITLPPDFEAWARTEVEAGRAESVEALAAKALTNHRAEVEYVRGKLEEARASLAEGRGIPLEEFLARGRDKVARLRATTKAAE